MKMYFEKFYLQIKNFDKMVYAFVFLILFVLFVFGLYKIIPIKSCTYKFLVIFFVLGLIVTVCYNVVKQYNSRLRSVLVTTSVTESPASICIEWDFEDPFAHYIIYKKNENEKEWGGHIADISGFKTKFVDRHVEIGKAYEYKIHKSRPFFEGFTYVFAGIKYQTPQIKSTVLLLVDSTYKTKLEIEIEQLKLDLVGDGWNVKTLFVDRNQKDSEVKRQIQKEFKHDNSITTLYILGHIAVPYSGNFAFDMHANHIGAWSADVYYADIEGLWTDTLVNTIYAAFPENHNVPNDGKWDQSFVEGKVKLEVGRVDFSNLPIYTESEIELTRRYLSKNHAFRMGLIQVDEKGLVNDQFKSILRRRSKAANGWRNFSAILGSSNIDIGDFKNTLTDSAYLFTYTCGPGSFTTVGDWVNSQDFAKNSYKSVFTILFGSYFGNWNTENNLARVALASNGYTLVTFWAGNPDWFFHHLGLGKNIGYSGLLTINNTSEYTQQFMQRGIHITVLGDPTLRSFIVKPIENLQINLKDEVVELAWTNSVENSVGFEVYRSKDKYSGYELLTSEFICENSYIDTLPLLQPFYYMVRTIVLQKTGSGSYFNRSHGVIAEVN